MEGSGGEKDETFSDIEAVQRATIRRATQIATIVKIRVAHAG
jgi:hypothetical protein